MREIKPKSNSTQAIYNNDQVTALQREIDSLRDNLSLLENKINVLEDKDSYNIQSLNSNVINGSIANITDLNAGNISTTNKVEAREIYSDTVTSDVVEANTANITEISADTIETNNLTIKDTITVDVDSDTISADYLSANNAHISTVESDNVDTTNVFASNGNIQNLTLGTSNITSAEIQNTNIINANVDEETVNKSNITLANVQSANIDIMQNRFKAHDKYFIDIPQPAGGNTDYKIIKLNPFINGTYRLTYVGLDGETLFSVIFTQAFDNISFKYTKNAEFAKRPAFEKVAIYNDYIYIQTFFGGRLYYQCDALNAEQQPSTYDEWPIDLLDEDCYVYEAARVYGDVYTHYVIAENMKDGGAVNKLLNVSAVDNIENINPKYGEEPLHYDGQEEINLNIYIPDQVLNTDSDVEFNKVTTKDLATTGSVTHFNDVITLRNGKETPVADMSGVAVKNYDGNNSDRTFGIDKDGDFNVASQKISTTEQINNTVIPFMDGTKWGNTNATYDKENARIDGIITKAIGDEDGNNIKDTYARQDGYIPREWLGVASTETRTGVATLNENGTIPVEQLPTEAILFKGMWNASTNTPTLADGTGTSGDYYIVSVGGTWNGIVFNEGDGVIYDGETWHRKADTNVVQSVNGQVGVVELDKADVGLSEVDNLAATDYLTDFSKEESGDITTLSITVGGTQKTVEVDNHHDDLFTDLSEPNDNEVSMTIGGVTKSLENIAMTDKDNTFTGMNSFDSIKLNGFTLTII